NDHDLPGRDENRYPDRVRDPSIAGTLLGQLWPIRAAPHPFRQQLYGALGESERQAVVLCRNRWSVCPTFHTATWAAPLSSRREGCGSHDVGRLLTRANRRGTGTSGPCRHSHHNDTLQSGQGDSGEPWIFPSAEANPQLSWHFHAFSRAPIAWSRLSGWGIYA